MLPEIGAKSTIQELHHKDNEKRNKVKVATNLYPQIILIISNLAKKSLKQ